MELKYSDLNRERQAEYDHYLRHRRYAPGFSPDDDIWPDIEALQVQYDRLREVIDSSDAFNMWCQSISKATPITLALYCWLYEKNMMGLMRTTGGLRQGCSGPDDSAITRRPKPLLLKALEPGNSNPGGKRHAFSRNEITNDEIKVVADRLAAERPYSSRRRRIGPNYPEAWLLAIAAETGERRSTIFDRLTEMGHPGPLLPRTTFKLG